MNSQQQQGEKQQVSYREIASRSRLSSGQPQLPAPMLAAFSIFPTARSCTERNTLEMVFYFFLHSVLGRSFLKPTES